jgi:hypothetical protein
MTLEGRLLGTTDTTPCLDPSADAEALACQVDMDCDSALTVAGPPGSPELYEFASGCLPPGWIPDNTGYEACPVACSDTPLTDCASANCQLISGVLLQPDGTGGLCEDLTVPPTAFECIEPIGCGDAISYASDASGVYWFSDTCTPAALTPETGPYSVCP